MPIEGNENEVAVASGGQLNMANITLRERRSNRCNSTHADPRYLQQHLYETLLQDGSCDCYGAGITAATHIQGVVRGNVPRPSSVSVWSSRAR